MQVACVGSSTATKPDRLSCDAKQPDAPQASVDEPDAELTGVVLRESARKTLQAHCPARLQRTKSVDEPRMEARDLLHEAEEVDRSVPVRSRVRDFAGDDVERGVEVQHTVALVAPFAARRSAPIGRAALV